MYRTIFRLEDDSFPVLAGELFYCCIRMVIGKILICMKRNTEKFKKLVFDRIFERSGTGYIVKKQSNVKKVRRGSGMNANKLLRYSMQLSMLKQLFSGKLINENEYQIILKKLMKDYGIVSNITA